MQSNQDWLAQDLDLIRQATTMWNPWEMAPSTIEAWQTFSIEGRRFRVGVAGVKAIELAHEILKRIERHESLLPLRDEIRRRRCTASAAVLAQLAGATKRPGLRLVAVWLRGLCGGYVGASILQQLSGDQHERTRLAVVRTLQRMSAWSTVTAMAVQDASPRVRRLAAAPERPTFKYRLQKFAAGVAPQPVELKRSPLFVSQSLDLASPVRIKSLELIRLLLDRIRRLVNRDSTDVPPQRIPDSATGAKL